MTTSDDRLDRIAALVESNALAIAAMRERQEAADQQLRESINDVMEIVGDLAEQQQETDQRFNNLLAESRSDRQSNRREHRDFREVMNNMLREIRELRQRIAG